MLHRKRALHVGEMGNEAIPLENPEKPAEPVPQASLPWGRYFVPENQDAKAGKGVACFFCRKRGHLARDCQEKISGAEICFFCDEKHDPTRCPLASHCCFICGSLGHRRQICPQRDNNSSRYCHYCDSTDHATIDCKICWRQYALISDAPSKEVEVVSCYTCSSTEHWGDDCPERYRTGFGGPTPFSSSMVAWMIKRHDELTADLRNDGRRGADRNGDGRGHGDRPRGRDTPRSDWGRDTPRSDRGRDTPRSDRDGGRRDSDRRRDDRREDRRDDRRDGDRRRRSRSPGANDRYQRPSRPEREREPSNSYDRRDRDRRDRERERERATSPPRYRERDREVGVRYDSGRRVEWVPTPERDPRHQRAPSPPKGGRWKGGYSR
ncbi:hypothetical protein DFJ74DRAFT_404127 [Hyaloraphidium curvatum]|nr:hypothetical protein DFJ74DRAFT_404127 [Hyaloraphidium curvatum]